jgi:hypothetical protein
MATSVAPMANPLVGNARQQPEFARCDGHHPANTTRIAA